MYFIYSNHICLKEVVIFVFVSVYYIIQYIVFIITKYHHYVKEKGCLPL